jgi:hypothetical protein
VYASDNGTVEVNNSESIVQTDLFEARIMAVRGHVRTKPDREGDNEL